MISQIVPKFFYFQRICNQIFGTDKKYNGEENQQTNQQKCQKKDQQRSIDFNLSKRIPIIPVPLKATLDKQTIQRKLKLKNQIIFQSIVQKNYSEIKKIKKTKVIFREPEFRNILPNSVHQVFSYILKQYKSDRRTNQIFDKINNNKKWTVKRYYIYISVLKNKINYYMNQNSFGLLTKIHEPCSQIYSIQEQHFYMKVARILAIQFLNKEAITVFLQSKRMSASIKYEHIKNRRRIMEKMKNIFQDA